VQGVTPALSGRGGGGKLAGVGLAPGSHGSEAPRVLLLPLQLGAAGLNLTEAQHVVIVEPLLAPGVAAQAVGRVDRIGQTRPTTVHHFVVGAVYQPSGHDHPSLSCPSC
jgi:hypothetical protein